MQEWGLRYFADAMIERLQTTRHMVNEARKKRLMTALHMARLCNGRSCTRELPELPAPQRAQAIEIYCLQARLRLRKAWHARTMLAKVVIFTTKQKRATKS